MKKIGLFVLLGMLSVLLTNCTEKTAPGYARFVIDYYWGTTPLAVGATYTTDYGPSVIVENHEFFLSDLRVNGPQRVPFKEDPVLYFNLDSTHNSYFSTISVPTGQYVSISFEVGVSADYNKTNYFTSSPQKDMAWPEALGGGYHHLKFDGRFGRFADLDSIIYPFNLHLGTLVIHELDSASGDVTTNRYEETFAINIMKSFYVHERMITTIHIACDLKQWVQNPNNWDFEKYYLNGIMDRPKAMDSLRWNGTSVFR
ncbi:hypothetical protein FACS1894201_05340 [Bacteroidia bacterium]|nr:hypothetical protein FACS1894201_05340 [Bacteroidia bacterium]